MAALHRNKKRNIIACWGMGISLLIFTGCAPIDKLQQWKSAQLAENNNLVMDDSPVYLGKAPTDGGEAASAPVLSSQVTLPEEQVEVSLYFTDEKGTSLIAEKRKLSKVEGIARATVTGLLQGPENKELKPSVPAGTMLKDINIKEDGCCIVDFSQGLVDNHSKEKEDEIVTVAAIVQTLSQFPSVSEVQILVEGKIISSIAGSVDISTPIPVNRP